MDSEKNRQQHRETSVSELLDKALVEAIVDGDSEAIHEYLAGQPLCEITNHVSNHLLIRNFYVIQKNRLIELHDALQPELSKERYYQLFQACIDSLDGNFSAMFISDRDGDHLMALRGDELFRQAVASSPEIARLIIEIDSGSLDNPRNLFDHTAVMNATIINRLDRALEDIPGYRSGTVMSNLKATLMEAITTIDETLRQNLPLVS